MAKASRRRRPRSSRVTFSTTCRCRPIIAPRWLLGRTWGAPTTTLELESRFDPGLVAALREAGHAVEIVDAFSAQMGHAGAISRAPDGTLAGAADPRSDGAVAAF